LLDPNFDSNTKIGKIERIDSISYLKNKEPKGKENTAAPSDSKENTETVPSDIKNEATSNFNSLSQLSTQSLPNIRKFHTSSCLFNSNEIQKIKDSEIVKEENKVVKLNGNFKLSTFLNDVKEIINVAENVDDNGKKEAQLKFENM
jgi:hypothetical protein